VAEQPVLDVLRDKRSAQQGGCLEVGSAHSQVVGRAPTRHRTRLSSSVPRGAVSREKDFRGGFLSWEWRQGRQLIRACCSSPDQHFGKNGEPSASLALGSWRIETFSFFGLGSPITAASSPRRSRLHCAHSRQSPSNNAHGLFAGLDGSSLGKHPKVRRISNSHPGVSWLKLIVPSYCS